MPDRQSGVHTNLPLNFCQSDQVSKDEKPMTSGTEESGDDAETDKAARGKTADDKRAEGERATNTDDKRAECERAGTEGASPNADRVTPEEEERLLIVTGSPRAEVEDEEVPELLGLASLFEENTTTAVTPTTTAATATTTAATTTTTGATATTTAATATATTAATGTATTVETKEQRPESAAAVTDSEVRMPEGEAEDKMEVEPEKEKPKAASATDGMDVVDPTAPAVFDPAIMEVDADTDWDAHAEMAAVQAHLPEDLPAANSPVQVIARSIFYSGMRRCWIGQSTTNRGFVTLSHFPVPDIIQGRTLALRYAAWLKVNRAHPELEMDSYIDVHVLEKANALMLVEFPEGAENIEGAKNRMDHWVEVVYNLERRERREGLRREEKEARDRVEKARQADRHQRLHGRNAPLRRDDDDGNRDKRVHHPHIPAFMRGIIPMEEEIDSLEKATGHFKAQFAELADKPLVKEATRGQAAIWPARHSDPISVSSCCKRCGGDQHGQPNARCPFDDLQVEDEEKRAADLPEDAKAEADDNVYVAMVMAGRTAAAKQRCGYELCDDRETHLTAACPTMHRRCSVCKFRGHRAETKVDGKFICLKKGTDAERHFAYRTPALLGVAFEKTADSGRYTRLRRALPAAGYFPCVGKMEEALLTLIGYEVVLRVGVSKTQTYLDGCRKAAQDAFGMDLVQEVVGQRYAMTREQEMAEYDDLVLAYTKAYAGVKERAVRKADLRVLQAEELARTISRARDQRDLTKASAHLAKIREDIWSLGNQLVKLQTQDSCVITGIEPIGKAVAIQRLAPKVRVIYQDREDAKDAQAARANASRGPQTTNASSYANTTKRSAPAMGAYPPTSATTSRPTTGSNASRPQTSRIGPSPDRKRSKRQEVAAALLEAYRAHQRYEAGGRKPTEAVTGIMTVPEFRRLTRAGHELFEHLESDRFYTRKGQLPKLSDEDLESLPRSMKKVPTGGIWRDVDFRPGELWQIASRFFYIRNAFGELEFDPQNARLPDLIRRFSPGESNRRSGSGRGGRGDRGDRGAEGRRERSASGSGRSGRNSGSRSRDHGRRR